jgi:hypothetical protein
MFSSRAPEALQTVWEALFTLRTTTMLEGDPKSDEEWGDICTAMAWLSEELGVDELEEEG